MSTTICITPDVVSQTRAYKLQSPFAVLHNKASKTPKIGTLTSLVFSHPYAEGPSPLLVTLDSNVPHINFSDLY
jgi:hypothetical protein